MFHRRVHVNISLLLQKTNGGPRKKKNSLKKRQKFSLFFCKVCWKSTSTTPKNQFELHDEFWRASLKPVLFAASSHRKTCQAKHDFRKIEKNSCYGPLHSEWIFTWRAVFCTGLFSFDQPVEKTNKANSRLPRGLKDRKELSCSIFAKFSPSTRQKSWRICWRSGKSTWSLTGSQWLIEAKYGTCTLCRKWKSQ